jgi:hypothetical protein
LRTGWQRTTALGAAFGDLVSAGYVAAVMVLSLATMVSQQYSPFLYFRF